MTCLTHDRPALPALEVGPKARKLALALAVTGAAYRCDAVPVPCPAYRAPLADDAPTTPHPIGPLPTLPPRVSR